MPKPSCVPLTCLWFYAEHRRTLFSMLQSYNLAFLRDIADKDTYINMYVSKYFKLAVYVTTWGKHMYLVVEYPDGDLLYLNVHHNDYVITDLSYSYGDLA